MGERCFFQYHWPPRKKFSNIPASKTFNPKQSVMRQFAMPVRPLENIPFLRLNLAARHMIAFLKSQI
jgi:hypothetical protein